MDLNPESENLPPDVASMLLEETFFPITVFLIIWLVLVITESILPKKHRFSIALIAAFGFLVFTFQGARFNHYLYYDLKNFQCMVFGACGLGLSLFAFRLEGVKRFRQLSRDKRVTWSSITFFLLFFTLYRLLHVLN